MKEYLVEWIIELEARTAEDAAKQALVIQRDCNSIATVFRVYIPDTDAYEDIDAKDIT